jgi:hypothetical protein
LNEEKRKKEELMRFLENFKSENDGKWIRNQNTGEFGYYVSGTLRTFEKENNRLVLALIDTIFRKFSGATINQVDWDKLPKSKF